MRIDKTIEILLDYAFSPLNALEFEDEITIKDCYRARHMAIGALEKQMPKEPQRKVALTEDVDIGVCPICSEIVRSDFRFCAGCGQRIDWEGVDDDI